MNYLQSVVSEWLLYTFDSNLHDTLVSLDIDGFLDEYLDQCLAYCESFNRLVEGLVEPEVTGTNVRSELIYLLTDNDGLFDLLFDYATKDPHAPTESEIECATYAVIDDLNKEWRARYANNT